MTYIRKIYGTIDGSDQTQKKFQMKQQWNPPKPILFLFEKIDDAQKYAAKDNETIESSELIRWDYDNVKVTGLIDKDCEKWRKRDSVT